jgi:4-amino-4-deoxy-L-arabinose transferase-like glycosyltransferase
MTRASATTLLAAIVGFGALCRIGQYAANTSLWHDEAFVALNVLHTEVRDLLRTPDWHEPSPPGFMLLEQLMVAAFGGSEYTLRLLPQLIGLVGLVLFAGLAAHLGQPAWGAAWAVALAALSDALIQQTNLVKHFTFDFLFAVTFAALALRALRQRDPTPTLLVWGLLGSVAQWVSYASVFAFAGSSLTLGLACLRQWEPRPRRAFLGANVTAIVSFLLLLIPIRTQRTAVVTAFWSETFPDTHSVAALAYWLGRAHLGLYHYLPEPVRVLGPLFVLFAVLWWWRHGRRVELLLLWAPIVLALVASSLHHWPFGGNQHMSFAAPAVIVTVGAGIAAAMPRLRRWHPRAAPAAAVILLLPACVRCVYHLAVPRQRHDVRAAIEFVEQQRLDTDAVVVFDPATFAFYTGRDVRHQQATPRPEERVWVITPSSKRGVLNAEVRRFVDQLGHRRPQLTAKQAYGAAALLFGPESAGAPSASPGTARLKS